MALPLGMVMSRVARGVAVSSDAMEEEEEEACEMFFSPDNVERLRGVAGTTVCVEVVDKEDDEDDEDEGAGEYERGEEDVGIAVGIISDSMGFVE